MKKLREKCKNKKGFTMVELIVVIVIILVLAAVLVPSLLKYINKANEANVKSDAATMLAQIQADYAAELTGDDSMDGIKVADSYGGVPVEKATNPLGSNTSFGDDKKAAYFIDSTTKEITSFAYGNGKHTAVWTQGTTTNSGGSTSTTGGWTIN